MGILRSKTFVVGPCEGKGGFFGFLKWPFMANAKLHRAIKHPLFTQYHTTPSILSIALNCYGTLGDGERHGNLCSQSCSHQVFIKFLECSHQVLSAIPSCSQCFPNLFDKFQMLSPPPPKMFPKPITLGHTINSRIQIFLLFSLIYSQIWLNPLCGGWHPAHPPHKKVLKKHPAYNKTSLLMQLDLGISLWLQSEECRLHF